MVPPSSSSLPLSEASWALSGAVADREREKTERMEGGERRQEERGRRNVIM